MSVLRLRNCVSLLCVYAFECITDPERQELVDKVNEVLGVQGNQPARSNSTTSVGSQSRLAPIDEDDDDDD